MAQQATNFVQEGVDRLYAARERVEEEVQKVQKDLGARRKSLERQTRKQVSKLQTELRRSPIVKRIETLRGDAARQVESTLEQILGALQIASRSEVEKIDRKLNKLTKRLKDIERARASNGRQTPAAQA